PRVAARARRERRGGRGRGSGARAGPRRPSALRTDPADRLGTGRAWRRDVLVCALVRGRDGGGDRDQRRVDGDRRARQLRRRAVPSREERARRRPVPEAMPLPRLIPCLDVAGGRVVKGVRFERLRDVGDPVELGGAYSDAGADELVFLDIAATIESRAAAVQLAGRDAARDALAWARECEARGAGELLVTSIDRDGTQRGYDLTLLARLRDAVSLPVIASGGAGNAQHVAAALDVADAALLASILH